MKHKRQTSVILFGSVVVLAATVMLFRDSFAQVFPKQVTLDRTKPVPAKEDVLSAWQRRQKAVNSFQFAWTEQQAHPKGWLSNPVFPQREWSNMPGLFADRSITVSKSLAVDGSKLHYSFELVRKEEADGVRVTSDKGDNKGLGLGRHYNYTSSFDGVTGKVRTTTVKTPPGAPGTKRTSEAEFPDPLTESVTMNVDSQNLDVRAMLMAYRAVHPVMGHTRLDRAVTNGGRTMYKGRSTFLLEESHDPSGWKTILRIEPERDMTVCQILVVFEQKLIADVHIDYSQDVKWGWVPSGWQVSQMLDDGSMRLLSTAKVTSYSINSPIDPALFK